MANRRTAMGISLTSAAKGPIYNVRVLWAVMERIRLVCTISMGTFGNGAKTGLVRMAPARLRIRPERRQVRLGFCGAARGAAALAAVVLRPVAAAYPLTVSSTLVCVLCVI